MIALYMNRRDYENDIRSLLMAFFYGDKIVLNAKEWDVCLDVRYTENYTSLSLKDNKGQCLEKEGNCHFEDYRLGRNDIKNLVYHILSEYTGMTLPWGTLTGIRPTKLPMEMYENGASKGDAIRYLKETYLVSDEKAELCAVVAENEAEVLKDCDYDHTFSLYVGIPFCPSICAYCSFSSYPLSVWEKQVDNYLDALCKEIEAASTMMGDRKLLTFYMGGGTPTSLSALQMDRLLTCLEKYFDLDHVSEKTVEAGRPDSITEDKLQVLRKHHIDRISINPQTMNQETLDLIGRRHTTEEVKKAFHMARKAGFTNINMDLIAGLTGDSLESFCHTVDQVIAMAPENITLHTLSVKRSSRLGQHAKDFYLQEHQRVTDMLSYAGRRFYQEQYRPYYLYRQKNTMENMENVGYCKEGKEGYYNVYIMDETHSIIALGAGGVSKLRRPGGTLLHRIFNYKYPYEYIERFDMVLRRKDEIIAFYRQTE